jgi:hypothetical protein
VAIVCASLHTAMLLEVSQRFMLWLRVLPVCLCRASRRHLACHACHIVSTTSPCTLSNAALQRLCHSCVSRNVAAGPQLACLQRAACCVYMPCVECLVHVSVVHACIVCGVYRVYRRRGVVPACTSLVLLLCLVLWCKLLLQPSQLTMLRIAAASFRSIPVVAWFAAEATAAVSPCVQSYHLVPCVE